MLVLNLNTSATKKRVDWLTNEMEHNFTKDHCRLEKKKRILEKLNQGVSSFEKFLHTKYVGQKRFSLEGGETTIPALDTIISQRQQTTTCMKWLLGWRIGEG